MAIISLPQGQGLFKAAMSAPILSADGTVYIVLTVNIPNVAFGPMVFKLAPDTTQLVLAELAEPMSYPGSHGALTVEHGALYLYATDDHARLHKIRVLGYIPLVASNGAAVQPTSNIDQHARDLALACQTQINDIIKQFHDFDLWVTSLAFRMRQLTDYASAAAIAWQKAVDAIEDKWQQWYKYTGENSDKRLLNLIHDRITRWHRLHGTKDPNEVLYNDPKRWE